MSTYPCLCCPFVMSPVQDTVTEEIAKLGTTTGTGATASVVNAGATGTFIVHLFDCDGNEYGDTTSDGHKRGEDERRQR